MKPLEQADTAKYKRDRAALLAQMGQPPVSDDDDMAVWKNDQYTVVHTRVESRDDSLPALHHLSIKRNDKEPIHDWRDLQSIKNQLLGNEQEAIELYPAESRVVDTANQYHLWALEGVKWDWIGWTEGLRIDSEEAAKIGAKQRDLE